MTEASPTPVEPDAISAARHGGWFNVGLGFGTLGCQDCVGREDGLSGGLSGGGTIGDKVRLGVGTTGWARTTNGTSITVGTLDARVRFYPKRRAGFFITGGIGLGGITVDGDTEFGVGLMIGIGWDLDVSPHVSLTPFYGGVGIANSTADAYFGQLGIGVTVH